MNNNEINSLIKGFIDKNGLTSAPSDAENRKKVEKMLGSLSDKQAQTLKSVLSDPKKSKEILNSPAAQALIRKLNK